MLYIQGLLASWIKRETWLRQRLWLWQRWRSRANAYIYLPANLDNYSYISNQDTSPWKNDLTQPRKLPFNQNPGIQIELPEDASVGDFMQLFLTDGFLEELVTRTNSHGEEVLSRMGLRKKHSRFNIWFETNVDEMRKFIGILLHMVIVRLLQNKCYWKTDDYFNITFFGSVMPKNRFKLLLRFWSFKGSEVDDNERLHLVKYLVDHFNSRMSLDESMVLWQGRLMFRQYIKNKKHKYGVKYFELCQHDGLILRCSISMV